jgi:hypothetical protein
VAIEPDLDRIWEVGADLDEPRTEVLIPQVEVETRDPPIGPVPTEVRRAPVPGRTGGAGGDPLELLGHSDRRDPRTPGVRLRLQVPTHHRDLAVPLDEAHHRDVVERGEPAHPVPEPVPDPTHHHRRGDREPPLRQVLHHLPANLQVRHVPVQVNPIQTLDIQGHMPIKDVVRRHRPRHHGTPPRPPGRRAPH